MNQKKIIHCQILFWRDEQLMEKILNNLIDDIKKNLNDDSVI